MNKRMSNGLGIATTLLLVVFTAWLLSVCRVALVVIGVLAMVAIACIVGKVVQICVLTSLESRDEAFVKKGGEQ